MPDHGGHEGKTRTGERLTYIRENHPDGPITIVGLAAKSGVSERYLRDVESGRANVTVEMLEKITQALGIDRVAYLLDDLVFDQVNAELRSLQEARDQGVSAIRLRSHTSHGTSPPQSGPDQEGVAAMLAWLSEIGDEAKRMQQDLPPT